MPVNADDLLARASQLDTPSGLRRLRLGILGLLLLSMGTCMANGANGPANPSLIEPARLPPFAQTGFRLVPTGTSATSAAVTAPTAAGRLCALLADTLLTRQRNLTGRGDLAGYSAMVLDFGELTVEPFAPQSVSLALTAVFFDAEGNYLAAGDTEPCITQAGCPPVAAPAPYRYLLLIPKGQLAAMGGPGARLEVGGDCPPAQA